MDRGRTMAVTHGDDSVPGEDDPFADLVLDESFVQGAKVSEAPARTREAIAKYAHLEHPVFGTGRPPERGPRSRKRRWITVTAVITLAALLGYIVWLTGRPSHAAAPQAPEISSNAPSPDRTTPSPAPSTEPMVKGYLSSTPVGSCLTWAKVRGATARTVPCSAPHLGQVTANIDLTATFHETWPGSAALHAFATAHCMRPFQMFTGITDGTTPYGSDELWPTSIAWNEGQRHLLCLAQRMDTAPFTGSVHNLRKPVTT
jgi:hypothetical protein